MVVGRQRILRVDRCQKVARNQLPALLWSVRAVSCAVLSSNGSTSKCCNQYLMDELIESMLAISARLAPDHRARAVIHNHLAICDRESAMNERTNERTNVIRAKKWLTRTLGDTLAIALHIALLKVGREAMEVLVVRQNAVRLGSEKVVVPDAQQALTVRSE